MPDEVAYKHSGIVVPSPEENASAPGTPGETVVTDYTAVPQMIAALKSIHDAAMPRLRKQVLTVLAQLHVVLLGSGGDPRPASSWSPPPSSGRLGGGSSLLLCDRMAIVIVA